jgi:predicted lysophospholipase L1 biosynthesis ABC-type transport system permease subunit
VGQEIRVIGLWNSSPWLTIVGVVGDWKHLEWDARWLDSPLVFRPLAQDPTEDNAIAVGTRRDITGVAHAAGVAHAISERIVSVDPSIPREPIQTLDSRLEDMRAYPRFRAFLVTFFALAALAIAAVGLHGTLSEFVSRRTPEFGLRRAVGARTADVLWLVVKQGGIPVVTGLISGAAAAPVLVRIAGSLFVGFKLWNPGTFLFSAFLLLAVAAITIALPARRAANVDPMAALRDD